VALRRHGPKGLLGPLFFPADPKRTEIPRSVQTPGRIPDHPATLRDDVAEAKQDQTAEELEDDDLEEVDPDDGLEPPEPDPATPASGSAQVESIEALLAKKDDARVIEDDALIGLSREERLETLAVKVIPPQPTEFVCKKCYLVKHQSQLKDKKRRLCRDCA